MSTQAHQPRSPAAGDGESTDAQAKAQEKAQKVAGQAQEKAQEAAGQAQARLREQLDQRSSQLAEQITGQASDLRTVSETLRDQGKEGPAKAADRLAGYAEKVGAYLRDRDSDALLRDAEEFGRRRPAVVAAGGVALGFVASRFLKASSAQRYSSQHVGQLPPPDPGVPPAALPGDGQASPPPVPGAAPPPPGDVPPMTPGV